MGTNYYLHRDVCPTCQRPSEVVHIGKSSAGWCFSLHVDDEIKSLDDWKAAWINGVIKNEYGDTITSEEMLSTITEREWTRGPEKHGPEWLRSNHAVDGPKGLARHAIGPHCVGHGEGTWDLIPGEFS